MKIVHINKSDVVGGASVAALRLVMAQRAIGFDSIMLVQEKNSNHDFVYSTTHTELKKRINNYRLAFEKLQFLPYEVSPAQRFAFSTSNTGENIHNHPLVKEADILHLHWFNQGYLSMASLRKLARKGKKIVWTMHDMWAFTGGCHYAGECQAFMDECNHCPLVKGNRENDKSTRIFRRKERLYDKVNWHFVSPSKWLKEQAQESALLKDHEIHHIVNPINLDMFKPGNKMQLREKNKLPLNKKLLLFGSMNISDTRKGFDYFVKALHLLKHQNIDNEVALLIFGKSTTELRTALPFTTYDLSLIENMEQMVEIYQMADIFVIPSLEDNLPNTVVEALSCGLPVVAFDGSGLSAMINHEEDGYLASFKSADDLAAGISWMLFESNLESLSHNARVNAEINYKSSEVAQRYIELYQDILNEKTNY
jgi:glycosyltransferase involved in cell wall biosynthesis